MSKIRILPEQLANQIAAGEVVERPASVVKELLENSLDAKANRVEIEIEGGGTRLIRIIDNGEGMAEDDLLLCLERHGTSKIRTEEDLGAISTLGFRGEAIPSIGSVSQLTITSRPVDQDLGTRVVLQFGKLTKVHEIGSSIGTTIEVRNLFGNTPARRKFLRTARTELGHIDEVVKNYALSSPQITFILRIDGRDTLYLDNSQTTEQRLGNVLRYDGPFIPVKTPSGSSNPRRISGFLLPPERVTNGPAKIRIFVNGRAIKDRMIIHAVTEGLRGFLMKGKNPSGLIHLELPPEEVDVNVHPAKHEVRFRNSRDVHNLLSRAVAEAINQHQQSIKATVFSTGQIPARSPIPLDSSWPPPENVLAAAEEHLAQQTDHRSKPLVNHANPSQEIISQQIENGNQALPHEPLRSGLIAADISHLTKEQTSNRSSDSPVDKSSLSPSQPLFATAEPIPQSHVDHTEHVAVKGHAKPMGEIKDIEKKGSPNQDASYGSLHHNLHIIGQLDNLYILCKNSEGLLVIDQHAAHERLLYEKLRHHYLANNMVRQTLMFPETVELSLFQSQLVENNQEEIDRFGFSIREFGGNSYIISAIPALAGRINPQELFFDILEQFGSEKNSSEKGGFLNTIVSTMACRAAVKAGIELSNTEIDNLLNEMVKADLFSHCPHGRPVIKQFTKDDLKKWFYRT